MKLRTTPLLLALGLVFGLTTTDNDGKTIGGMAEKWDSADTNCGHSTCAMPNGAMATQLPQKILFTASAV